MAIDFSCRNIHLKYRTVYAEKLKANQEFKLLIQNRMNSKIQFNVKDIQIFGENKSKNFNKTRTEFQMF